MWARRLWMRDVLRMSRACFERGFPVVGHSGPIRYFPYPEDSLLGTDDDTGMVWVDRTRVRVTR